MVTKLLAALVAAAAVGMTGVYFATSAGTDGGCPLSGGCQTATSPCCLVPVSECDAATGCPLAAQSQADDECCPSCSKTSGKTLARGAALGCGVIGAETCPGAVCDEKK
jgi:hypothetical protein